MKDKLTVLSIFSYVLFLVLINNLTVSYEGVESAGKNMPFDGEENPDYGKAYVLESDDYVEKALALTDAYSNLDKETFTSLIHERMLPFADQMDDQESYSWKPWAMVPLRRVDDDGAFVVSWSYDESVQDNGSKSATHYIDVLRFNDEDGGKLSGMWSTYRPDVENSEYGLPEGGKFIGLNPENEYSGRAFVFSNRGEVETMEKFLESANNMDTEAAFEFLTDPFQYNGSDVSHDDFREIMANRESQDWKPWAMIPIKIKDTDPESGLIVHSRAKIVNKDGTVYEFDAAETYFFNLEGKISGVNQFTRAIPESQE
tara:strand:- start:111 stop:1055 length:945 start_codon:yes stop_codon:yes gene_type:complete